MFHDQQAEALSVAYIFISKMRFKARDQVNFCIKPFQTGLLTTINAICMLHEDLKTLYNEPLLLLLHLSQDELERFFGQIRGLGGGFCLHPKALQFLQRLGQSVILILLKDKLFIFYIIFGCLLLKGNWCITLMPGSQEHRVNHCNYQNESVSL